MKNFENLKLVGVDDLKEGDVLHLKVNSVFTGYHAVRPAINMVQVSMLDSVFHNPESIYYDLIRKYIEDKIAKDDPDSSLSSVADAMRDLTDTGHSTIYVGNGDVIETTGAGCRL